MVNIGEKDDDRRISDEERGCFDSPVSAPVVEYQQVKQYEGCQT
jgi:hypothetical protein